MFVSISAGLGQEGVDLINEDNTGLVLSSFLEELSDTFGTNAHKHLIKTCSGAVQEGTAGLSSDGS